MRKSNNKLVTKGLAFLENVAKRKANARCLGMLYEPKVPKRLSASKRVLSLALAVLIAASCVMSGGVEKFYAADKSNVYWDVSMASPMSSNTTRASAFRSKEDYMWKVETLSSPSGYATVTLTALNGTLTMNAGYSNQLSGVGSKTFKVSEFNNSYSDTYAVFQLKLSYDAIPTMAHGYIIVL